MASCDSACWKTSRSSPRAAEIKLSDDDRPLENVLAALQNLRADHDAGLAGIKTLELQQTATRKSIHLITERLESMLSFEEDRRTHRQAEVAEVEQSTAVSEPTVMTPIEISSLETPLSRTQDSPTPQTKHRAHIASQLHSGFRNKDSVLRNVVQESLSHASRSMSSSRVSVNSLKHSLKQVAASIVVDRRFEYFISFVIILNALCIGAEAEISLNYKNVQWPESLEYVFLFIYMMELILRLVANGRNNFGDPWFDFDIVLVALSLIGVIMSHMKTSLRGAWNSIMVLRSLRLLRLARALRMVQHFKTVWRLVYGLFTSTTTVASTCLLLLLSLYVFSCLALELIAKDSQLLANPETAQVIDMHFSGLGRAMLTLLQFVTLDSVAQVYFPLIIQKPELSVYFLVVLLFISISLMNLVTAVIVEGALSHSKHEEDETKAHLKLQLRDAMPRIIEMFEALDTDGSGEISRDEIENIPLDILPVRVRESVSVDSMLDLFELLDIDGTGSLSREEFVEGILNLFLLDVPVTTIQTLRLLRASNAKLTRIQAEMSIGCQLV